MRPRSAYEDGHDHIVDVPSYAVMIKVYKPLRDLCGHVFPLRTPLTLSYDSPLITFLFVFVLGFYKVTLTYFDF